LMTICLFSTSPPPTALPPLSLHDALPISQALLLGHRLPREGEGVFASAEHLHHVDGPGHLAQIGVRPLAEDLRRLRIHRDDAVRSEEHMSELQSRENLVCRLLLEKKK